MDLATILGLIIGFVGLIYGFILEEGDVLALIALSPAVIVFGGTIGAVMISTSMKTLAKTPKLILETITLRKSNVRDAIDTIVKLATIARREGLLSLENVLEEDNEFKNIDPVMKKGIMLAIDGTSPEVIGDILNSRIYVSEAERKEEIAMFEAAGGFAPTMGIIGTVMGLINVLGNLSNAEELAHSIAAAFIATLYGVCSANVVYLPFAAKLKGRMKEEKFEKEVILEGVLAISVGENPMLIKEKLNALFDNNEKKKMDRNSGVASEM